MNYLAYYNIDVVNGPGTRCTLFVCGCEHCCDGCYNKKTWDFNSGFLFDPMIEDQIISDLNDTRIKRRGLSLSGGEPLHPNNLDSIFHLVERIRKECDPNKDIWMWTGYVLADLTPDQMKIVDMIDVLVDGKFVKALADKRLKLRGSSNQVVHRFDRSEAWWKKK